MNFIKSFILLILFASCKNNDENKLLYTQLDNYNEFLKNVAKSQQAAVFSSSIGNVYLKKRYDSLNKIELKLEI